VGGLKTEPFEKISAIAGDDSFSAIAAGGIIVRQ
jgi:hypothetical protein